jgi:uncharacterized OB-fold protein
MVTRVLHPALEHLVPHVLAAVELAEDAGLRVVSTFVDVLPEKVRADMPVQVCFVGDGLLLEEFSA